MSIISIGNNQIRKLPFGVVFFCLYTLFITGIFPFINSLTILDPHGIPYPSLYGVPTTLIKIGSYFMLLFSFGIILSSIYTLKRKNIARKTLLVLFSLNQVTFLSYLVLHFPFGHDKLNMQLISCGEPLALVIFLVIFIWYFNSSNVKSFYS